MYRKAWTQSSAVSASARLRLFSHGITYQVAINKSRMKLSVLHQSIGPNYVKVLAQPGIGSLTREVIAQVKAAVRETGRRAAAITSVLGQRTIAEQSPWRSASHET